MRKNEPDSVEIINPDTINYQLAYRKAERDKADLMYENQMLRGKITTMTWLLMALVVIFMVVIFVNASK